MNDSTLIKVARALGDPTRLGILRAIASNHGMCCGDLTRTFPITAATVTHHVRILSEAGLVEARRDGQFIRVRAVLERLQEYRDAIGRLVDGVSDTAAAAVPSERRAS
jgi:ArsR family transcriptional regulator